MRTGGRTKRKRGMTRSNNSNRGDGARGGAAWVEPQDEEEEQEKEEEAEAADQHRKPSPSPAIITTIATTRLGA